MKKLVLQGILREGKRKDLKPEDVGRIVYRPTHATHDKYTARQ